MIILESRVSTQVVKEIEISRHWRLDEDRAGKGEDVVCSNMSATKQARKT